MRALVAMVAVAAMLAGCAGEPGPTETGAGPSVITDPRDFSDANGTGAHVHDYWGGADQLEVLDLSRGSTWNTVDPGFDWRVYFSPPDEKVVPQGTASLSITVSWADAAPTDRYADVSLWVKPANSDEHRFVQVVTSGTTVELPLLYDEADLPHQLISAWEFAVQFNNTNTGYSAFFGSTHLTVTANRGLELQPFPAHPDHWLGRTEFTLVEAQSTYFQIGYTGTGQLNPRLRPENGTIVPSDAGYVTVVLTLSPDVPVGAVDVLFHAADSRSFTRLEPESEQGEVQTFTIPIEPGMGDGPYNNASLWEFRIATPPTSADPDEPSVYRGGYHLVATVHKGGA